jgi:hypothetical protein
VTYRWIEDGTTDHLAELQRDELRQCQALAELQKGLEILGEVLQRRRAVSYAVL